MSGDKPIAQGAVYDSKLLFPVLFLVGIGIVMVYSASSALALKRFSTDYFFLKKQAFFALAGIVALVGCRHFSYKHFRSLTYPFLVLAILLLVAIKLFGLGYSAGGSMRWLKIGSFTFQPSEFARFALIIYLAYSMDKKKEHIKDFSVGFLPHVLVLGIFIALILIQPDFGSVVIIGTITWLMLFVGGVRISHLLLSLIFILPAAYISMISAEYRIRRIISFLDPWQYPSDEGYQIIHSLMAFGTGGFWGTGIGKGYQKLFYLP